MGGNEILEYSNARARQKEVSRGPHCHGGVRVDLRRICVSLVLIVSSSTTTKLLMNAILARMESIYRTGTVWLMV